jgi:hypothetical protein
MNISCPNHSVEDLDTALLPFKNRSFLTATIDRTPDGLLSEKQFKLLLNNAYRTGEYIKYNAYSFYELGSALNREYCYSLERYVFFQKQYINTKNTEFQQKADTFKQRMVDLMVCIDYMEKLHAVGDEAIMIKPTLSTLPLSSSQIVETMQDLALRTDMMEYSAEKNRSARNLLALYGFLNLSAVGLLIYIYRSK